MKLIRPISEKKRRILEEELETQKKRFANAARQSAEKIRLDLSLVKVLREHPLQSATVLALGGFIVAQFALGHTPREAQNEIPLQEALEPQEE